MSQFASMVRSCRISVFSRSGYFMYFTTIRTQWCTVYIIDWKIVVTHLPWCKYYTKCLTKFHTYNNFNKGELFYLIYWLSDLCNLLDNIFFPYSFFSFLLLDAAPHPTFLIHKLQLTYFLKTFFRYLHSLFFS